MTGNKENTMRPIVLACSVALISLAATACGGGAARGGAPAAPSALVASPAQGYIHLAWTDNSSNEIHFMVERKSGSEFQTLATVAADTVEYDDMTAAAGSTYVYRVTAMGADGQTGSSNEASARVSVADLGTPSDATTPPDALKGSAQCHLAGCRAFSSYCSTSPCQCIAIVADNPDPACNGTTVTCPADPCVGKTASCNHNTGVCYLQ